MPANSYLHSNRPDDFIRSSVHPILVRSSGVSTACFVPSFSRQLIFPSVDHTLWTLDVSALISLIIFDLSAVRSSTMNTDCFSSFSIFFRFITSIFLSRLTNFAMIAMIYLGQSRARAHHALQPRIMNNGVDAFALNTLLAHLHKLFYLHKICRPMS